MIRISTDSYGARLWIAGCGLVALFGYLGRSTSYGCDDGYVRSSSTLCSASPGMQIAMIAGGSGVLSLILYIVSFLRSGGSASTDTSRTRPRDSMIGVASTNVNPDMVGSRTSAQWKSASDAMQVGIASKSRTPPLSVGSALNSSTFREAEAYAHEHRKRLHEASLGSVPYAANELRDLDPFQPKTWVFTDSHRPLLVAVGDRLLYEAGKYSMFKRSNDFGHSVTYGRDRFGRISLCIDSRLLRDLEPQENAERLVRQLQIPEDPTLLDDSDTEVLYEFDESSVAVRSSLEVALTHHSVPFEWDGDELVIPKIHEVLVDQLIAAAEAAKDVEVGHQEETTEVEDLGQKFGVVEREEEITEIDELSRRLIRLNKLKEEGLISEDELTERRRELLKEI